jgi:hypothetical protein
VRHVVPDLRLVDAIEGGVEGLDLRTGAVI